MGNVYNTHRKATPRRGWIQFQGFIPPVDPTHVRFSRKRQFSILRLAETQEFQRNETLGKMESATAKY